jgi:hypothetical protein
MHGTSLKHVPLPPPTVSLAYVEKRRVEAPEISVRLRRETPTTWYGLIKPEMRYYLARIIEAGCSYVEH